MQARTITGTGLAQTLAQKLRRGAAALAGSWRQLVGKPYRPEKHYMRGPGPKWRAKHAKAGTHRATQGGPRQDATHGG